jgi:hypothetical protein
MATSLHESYASAFFNYLMLEETFRARLGMGIWPVSF